MLPLATRLRLLPLHHESSPVPTPIVTLSQTSGDFSFAPVVKSIKISRPREKKLAILRCWYYALVPDEKNSGRLRYVTRNEVIVRYKVCFNIEFGAWWVCVYVLYFCTAALAGQRTYFPNFKPIPVPNSLRVKPGLPDLLFPISARAIVGVYYGI